MSTEKTIALIKRIDELEQRELVVLDDTAKQEVAAITKEISEDFSSVSFLAPVELAAELIKRNVIISNIFAMSDYKNTDEALKKIMTQQDSVIKILTLYSHRNLIKLPLEQLFAASPILASLWWSVVLSHANNSNTNFIFHNIQHFCNDLPLDKYVIPDLAWTEKHPEHLTAYFYASYINPQREQPIHTAIYREIDKAINFEKDISSPNPDFGKILVISWSMAKKHAVYKSVSKLFFSLKKNYRLHLLNLRTDNSPGDNELFEKNLSLDDVAELKALIQRENYGIVIFPEIGFSKTSVIFSHMRLAPIQITTYGHPVSSFSPYIDYFIAGREVENMQAVKGNYLEKPVLIPGLAALPIYPRYVPQKKISTDSDTIVIGCNWGNIKFYYPILLTLKKIIQGSNKKIVLSFPSLNDERCAFIPFMEELKKTLADEKVIDMVGYPKVTFEIYIEQLNECDVLLDSYPFGGYNRILDALCLGKPIVVFEGSQAKNRLAAALLRSVGLTELIATSEEEYVEKTVRLINDYSYRQKIEQQISSIDLKEKIFNTGMEKGFAEAIDAIVKHHTRAAA